MTKRLALLLFFVSLSGMVFSQTAVVKGRLSDEDGMALESATVIIEGTTMGTSANKEGDFSLKVPANTDINLVVSYTGKKTKKFPLRLLENQEYILVGTLESEQVLID